MRNLVGLVLAGGESRRMGREKGLLTTFTGSPWAVHQMKQLENCGIPAFLSVRSEQYSKYNSLVEKVKIIADSVTVKGPLTGLLSAQSVLVDADFLVLPCDMISVDENTLQSLISAYTTGDSEVFLYFKEQEIYPLCAIYTKNALRKVRRLYDSNQLESFSLKKLLEHLVCKLISPEDLNRLHNYNYPEDLRAEG